MGRLEDITGQRFGRLIALSLDAERTASNNARWLCRCDCGVEKVLPAYRLKNGRTTSCGCFRDEHMKARATTHGMSRTPTWNSWDSMIRRCTCPSFSAYPAYGGAGVTVCARWLESFENFLADMGVRPKGTTLDRFPDHAGDYKPGNCRWATPKEQSDNRGDYNVRIIYEGEEMAVKDYATRAGVSLAEAYRMAKDGRVVTR